MMRYILTTLLSAGLVFSMPVGTAFAQQAANSTEVAQKVETLSSQGAQKYRAQDYRGAIEAFEQAYELEPVPNLLYNIAKCYEKLENWERAISFYERFVVAPDVESDARQHALTQVQSLRQKTQSKSEPYQNKQEESDKATAQSQYMPAPREAGPDRTLSYVLFGTGAGLAATGAVFGLLASQDETQFKQAADTDTELRRSARDAGKTKALVADGLFIAGGITAIIGTYLFFTAKAPDTPAANATIVTPWISKSSAGLGMSFDF